MTQNDYVIHEGIIRTIIDLISDGGFDPAKLTIAGIKKVAGNNMFNKKSTVPYFTSLTKATSNLILTFPVICDESVPLSTSRMITKAIERKVVAMLQMLFSAVNITNNKDAFDFIGKVHKNLTSDDVLSFINKIDSSSFKNEAEENRITEVSVRLLDEAWNDYLASPEIFLEDTLKPALDEMFKFSPYSLDVVQEAGRHRVNYNRRNGGGGVHNPNMRGGFHTPKRPTSANTSPNPATSPKPSTPNPATPQNKKDNDDNNAITYIRNQVLDTDIKKANEEAPSLMVIRFRMNKPTQNGQQPTDDVVGNAIIGVKAKLVYVSQYDMENRIMLKNSDQNTFFSILKASTGEISLIKDLMFATDRAKLDIFSRKSNNTSPIWKLLERRASVAKGNRVFNRTNGNGTSIATLVISSDTEDRLKKDFDFRCSPSKLLSVMEDYSVMGFVITDDVTEKARFLWDDNSTEFEVISYTSLEKEDKSQYKKMMNLLIGK